MQRLFMIGLLLVGLSVTSFAQKTFDIAAFYKAMASTELQDVERQLTILSHTSLAEKEAYEGSLIMKKSGFPAKAKEKLKLFKEGRLKLENAITKDAANAEYRLLRLIIQENAPKVVKYRSDIEKDAAIVQSAYKKLSPAIQQAVIDYSKTSKNLKLSGS